jgi:cytochrome c-type biogenesis protein CcmF
MAAFAGALAIVLVVYLFVDGASVFAALACGLAAWLILGALTDLWIKAGFGSAAAGTALRRLAGLPMSMFGTAAAHLGLGLTLLGIVGTLAFQQERIVEIKPGEAIEIAGYRLVYEGLGPFKGANYDEEQGTFRIMSSGGADIGTVVSAKRFYPARRRPTTEAGIRTMGFSQLYVSLGDQTTSGGIVARVWWKPMVTLIWIGGLVMMAGAGVSLFDRRLRVGAPAKRRAAKPAMQGGAA